MNKEYNGWTNYETWRVNLEIFDGINFVKEDFVPDELTLTIEALADHLRNVAEDAITNQGELDGLAVDYARLFINEVNYLEIAKSLVDSTPELIA